MVKILISTFLFIFNKLPVKEFKLYSLVPLNSDMKSCAVHSDKEICTDSCGAGSINGSCIWRPPSSTIIDHPPIQTYATCSPNLATCPNRICDELEEAMPDLCPQDCTESKYSKYFKVSWQQLWKGLV